MTDPEPDEGDGDGPGEAEQALSIVKELRKLILEILDRLTDAVKYGRRTRMMSWLLVASVTLDIALSVVAIRVLVTEARQQTAIHTSQLAACAIGNQSRAAQIQLWDHVIAVSKPPPHETAAQRQQRLATLSAFRAYVRTQFKPVNCHTLYP